MSPVQKVKQLCFETIFTKETNQVQMFEHVKESLLRKQVLFDHINLYTYIDNVDVSNTTLVQQDVLLVGLLMLPYKL